MRPIRITNDKISPWKNIAGLISNANKKKSLMMKQCCTKKKHALSKMIQRKFVSIFSVDEFIFDHENTNNITFKIKFLTNFMLFVALFVRNKFAYQILHKVRNIKS